MVASPTMRSILEFTQGLTVNKTAEFLRLLPGLKPADAPKSPWYLDKAKKFLTRTLEERTYKLKETVHIKKRKKDKEKARRAARATVSAPAADAAAPKEPPVLVLIVCTPSRIRSALRFESTTLLASISYSASPSGMTSTRGDGSASATAQRLVRHCTPVRQ